MAEPKGRKSKEHDVMLRRMALQIAGQLPDDLDDAKKIIAYMGELAETFLDSPESKSPKLTIVGKDGVG